MASILERLNKEIFNEICTEKELPKVQEQKQTGVEKYQGYLEKDQVFDVVFTSVDPDATFSAVDGKSFDFYASLWSFLPWLLLFALLIIVWLVLLVTHPIRI